MSTFRAFMFLTLLPTALLSGCERAGEGAAGESPALTEKSVDAPAFHMVGKLESRRLDEASGIQAGFGGVFFLHNDEGDTLYLADAAGRDLGSAKVRGAKNRDWEDITRVPGPNGPLLVLADTGDNRASRSRPSLYFLPEPGIENLEAGFEIRHRLRFTYPDGPRDVEALAYDPASGQLLLLSKRDQPPRLYGLPLDLALWQHELEAEFLGEVPSLRPPTRSDILRNPGRGLWVSQPTGMDISPNGRLAAVITYRSLYLFRREGQQSWIQALQQQPVEYIGPPGTHDEAVTFSLDGRSVFVTTERRPAPVYRLDLPEELLAAGAADPE
jgi:hypothetical protein